MCMGYGAPAGEAALTLRARAAGARVNHPAALDGRADIR